MAKDPTGILNRRCLMLHLWKMYSDLRGPVVYHSHSLFKIHHPRWWERPSKCSRNTHPAKRETTAGVTTSSHTLLGKTSLWILGNSKMLFQFSPAGLSNLCMFTTSFSTWLLYLGHHIIAQGPLATHFLPNSTFTANMYSLWHSFFERLALPCRFLFSIQTFL